MASLTGRKAVNGYRMTLVRGTDDSGADETGLVQRQRLLDSVGPVHFLKGYL
jgi:hypothetical protein